MIMLVKWAVTYGMCGKIFSRYHVLVWRKTATTEHASLTTPSDGGPTAERLLSRLVR